MGCRRPLNDTECVIFKCFHVGKKHKRWFEGGKTKIWEALLYSAKNQMLNNFCICFLSFSKA